MKQLFLLLSNLILDSIEEYRNAFLLTKIKSQPVPPQKKCVPHILMVEGSLSYSLGILPGCTCRKCLGTCLSSDYTFQPKVLVTIRTKAFTKEKVEAELSLLREAQNMSQVAKQSKTLETLHTVFQCGTVDSVDKHHSISLFRIKPKITTLQNLTKGKHFSTEKK